MSKSADAFRTISEVAEWLETPAHVLRFWESKFSQIKPVKRAGGRRYYRPADMLLVGGIKQLLHNDGLTIKGAQKILREQGVKHVAAMSQPLEGEENSVYVETPPIDDHDDITIEVPLTDETQTAEVVQFIPNEPKTVEPKETTPPVSTDTVISTDTKSEPQDEALSETEIPKDVSAEAEESPNTVNTTDTDTDTDKLEPDPSDVQQTSPIEDIEIEPQVPQEIEPEVASSDLDEVNDVDETMSFRHRSDAPQDNTDIDTDIDTDTDIDVAPTTDADTDITPDSATDDSEEPANSVSSQDKAPIEKEPITEASPPTQETTAPASATLVVSTPPDPDNNSTDISVTTGVLTAIANSSRSLSSTQADDIKQLIDRLTLLREKLSIPL